MNEFTEIYKKLSDRELVAITLHAENYKSTAVATAKLELASRNIPQEELQNLQTQIVSEKRQKESIQQQRKQQNEAFHNTFFAAFKNVNFLEKGIVSHEREIRILCWFFALITTYVCYTSIWFAVALIESAYKGYAGLAEYLFLLNLLTLIVGTFLFWRRNKFGWILMMFYVASLIVGFLGSSFYNASRQAYIFDRMIDEMMMSNVVLIKYLLYGAFFSYCYYVLQKRVVKAEFNVNKRVSMITIFIAFALQAIFWLSLTFD
jgi:hypothetical protein